MDNLHTARTESRIPQKQSNAPGSGGGIVRWVGVVMAMMCVLAVAVKVAFALTYAGPVTVTANMGSFSPNPVKVNSSATSSLSANYNPPSGVPEGDLSAQYDWSVSQVQYKALQADAYGSPPTDSYTDSISPTQPSVQSGAMLTFTPKKTGYWAVSVSCGVTVTDTQTNQYWSGSGNAGPKDLTSYTLDITYTGSVVGGPSDSGTVVTNKTTDVHAGYPIQLGIANLAPTDLAKTFNWTIAGAGDNGSAAIGGYDPTTNAPSYVTTLNPAKTTGEIFPAPNQYYYYNAGDNDQSQSEDVQVFPSGGSISSAVKTTFDVTKPTEALTTVTSVACGGTGWIQGLGLNAMAFGDIVLNPANAGSPNPAQVGIDFLSKPGSVAGFNGDFTWVQVYYPQQFFYDANGNVLGVITGGGLDTAFPYPLGPNVPDLNVFENNDNPATAPLAAQNAQEGVNDVANVTKIVVSDKATMWLLYKPKPAGSIWVPVDSVDWNWSGTDSLNAGQWQVANGTGIAKNPAGKATDTFPTWSTLANRQFH